MTLLRKLPFTSTLPRTISVVSQAAEFFEGDLIDCEINEDIRKLKEEERISPFREFYERLISTALANGKDGHKIKKVIQKYASSFKFVPVAFHDQFTAELLAVSL